MAALDAWMNGKHVGTWHVLRGGHRFAYTPEWLASDVARPLSLSLPFTPTLEITGDVVVNYFDNLLPDNERIRERIGRRFGAKRLDAFALLQAIGRDCIGAVQLLPQGSTPEGWDRIDAEPLTEAQVAKLIRAVPADPLAPGHVDKELFRISLAGAQEKTALTRVGDQWCVPRGATPSTHIFKLPLGRVANVGRVELFDTVENEWLCAQLIHALGLPVAQAQMGLFEDQRVLVVERFDRESMNDGAWIARLPQEDFCQALGVSPRMKYESDGGPGIADGLHLLAGSQEAEVDRAIFQLTQLMFWLMAAPDGHAKNYSIFLRRGGSYELTPLYDVLSVWPYMGRRQGQLHRTDVKLAMALRSKNVHYAISTMLPRHWQAMALANGGQDVWKAMIELVERVPQALAEVEAQLSTDFPERIWAPIANGMREQAQKFLAALN